jgi:hypothetical protein
MAKSEEQITHTTFDGRTITDANALLRDPKVQETIRKLSRNRDYGRPKGSITILRYRKPD